MGDCTTPGDDTFLFFSLPRELRNSVYAYLFGLALPVSAARVHLTMAEHLVLVDRNCLSPTRGICRQFKEEYEDEAFQHAKVTLVIDLEVSRNISLHAELSRSPLKSYQHRIQHVAVCLRTHLTQNCSFRGA